MTWSISNLGLCLIGALMAATPNADAQLRVGLSLPMSGPSAVIGSEVAMGFDIAARQLLNGRNVKIVIVDDICRPDIAVQQTQKLLERDNIQIAAGYPCLATTNAVAPVYADHKVPFLSLTEPVAAPREGSPYSFYAFSTKADRLVGLAHILSAVAKGPKPVLYLPSFLNIGGIETPKGRSVMEAASLKKYSALKPDDDALLKDADIADSTVGIFYQFYVGDVGAQLKALKDGRASAVIASFATMPAQYNELLRGSARLSILSGALPRSDGPAGLPRTGLAPYGFAIAQIVSQLLKETNGNADAEKLTRMLHEETYATVLGALKFDKVGMAVGLHLQFARTVGNVAAISDVCERDDCHDFPQCPDKCPIRN